MRPDPSHLPGVRAAHARLLETIGGLDDATARAASLLPGWSVGHVLTHLARNAESFVRLADALVAGVPAVQYPGGVEQRAHDIEVGAGRPADVLVADVRATAAALDDAFAALPDGLWDATVRVTLGEARMWDVPFRRWREVELHHVDLGLGFGFADCSSAYVREELRRREMAWRASNGPFGGGLPEPALRLPPTRRLAWLVGRFEIDGLPHQQL